MPLHDTEQTPPADKDHVTKWKATEKVCEWSSSLVKAQAKYDLSH